MQILKKATLILTTALIANVSWSAQSDIDAIEDAYLGGQPAALVNLIDSTQGYDRFLAKYRLGMMYSFSQQSDQAKATFASLISGLEEHLVANPNDSEALVLLAYTCGYSITLDPAKATSYGQKSYQALAKAETLAPNNPRVYLVKGILQYNTPAAYGGSKDIAKQALEQALALYPNDVNSGYYWGHDEANIWLGLTLLELGDKTSALTHFQAAATLEPNNGWAKYLLSSNTQ
ncbi:tetratricopeptide repeat protein [Gilvimarinus sp. SDUM040013]|uniref:Tetratricopeptide repeat protein n=1 Tax=Gilvimarinus gilvus TaxID=3058038 RepID=A0ABU4S157_9GAMM|nr:tetratricopeptide repeat protein [Gilvimarinus sp. SDUM040013]MDO3388693.1 tetratricopeptide repeat protein [Gilvimarinus sp. SDUM040013]MDX6849588.1 tetratricopeptide repeat protein [Gilvimarinus sp. SDUM040013]